MSIIGSNILAGASGQAAGGFEIEQSLRFDGGAYLSRTPSAAGTLGTWTISYWAKRSKSGLNMLFNSGSVNQQGVVYMTDSADNMSVLGFNSTAQAKGWASYGGVGKLRDFSAWYHVLIRAFSSSSANSYDGVELEIYINGEETGTSIAGGSPTGGCRINDGQAKTIGYSAPDGYYFNGYVAEWHLVDGTAAAVTDFGEFDNNGVWRPIEYTGSHGTQGYYLKFDPSATNGIGHDHSGNGNNFSPTGFTTSGTGTDVMSDTPTTNYATWNGVAIGADATLTNGNLDIAYGSSTTRQGTAATIGVSSGKWYWEVTLNASSITNSVLLIGITKTATPNEIGTYVGEKATDYGYYGNEGTKYNNATSTSYGATYAPGDTLGFALDMDAGTCVAYKNNSSQGTLASGLTGTYFPAISDATPTNTSSASINFGQRAFAYTPPTGFKALNTANLPAPDIADGSKYFNTVLYTGNNLEQVITGVNFQPDWVWVKCRNQGSTNHVLQDAVRGAQKYLTSDTTVVEGTSNGTIISFDSDGFTIGAGNPAVPVNNNGDTFVAWNWLAGGSGSSNTDGSITSTVSANPSAGFSIVTYTGTGSNATVGHGLGVVPSMIMVKNRIDTNSWQVYHSALGPTKVIFLNSTQAVLTSSTRWNNTAPTSTVFTIGTDSGVNGSGDGHVAYCFAEVENYSKFGSYTGNGSTNGPFVYTGHKVGWLMIKNVSANSEWSIIDAARDPYNRGENYLSASSAGAEASGFFRDNLSNGFKIRDNGSGVNTNGNTYIFMSFAEHPFGGSGVSPATAR